MKVASTGRLWERAARHLLPVAAPVLLLAALAHVAAAQPSAGSPGGRGRRAETLSDYQTRVQIALGLVEELALVYERRVGGKTEGAGSEVALKGMTGRVKSTLPAKGRVEWGGGFIEADNSWLHQTLEKLETEGDDTKVAAGLRAAAGRLRALEARLRELDASARADLDRDAERGRLNSILRRPEFERQAPKQRGALERMIEDFAEWLSGLFPKGAQVSPGGSPGFSKLTLVLVGVLCLAVLAYLARLLWLRRGAGRKSPGRKREARVVLGERLEADQTASDLLDEAERLARVGELRGAIRKAYVALLCELGDRGVVRLAQHKTNRDYLDAVRRAARPALYTELLPLTNAFELHWYGLRAASDADWQSFKTRCRAILNEVVSRQ
jgi:hypothetical protein